MRNVTLLIVYFWTNFVSVSGGQEMYQRTSLSVFFCEEIFFCEELEFSWCIEYNYDVIDDW